MSDDLDKLRRLVPEVVRPHRQRHDAVQDEFKAWCEALSGALEVAAPALAFLHGQIDIEDTWVSKGSASAPEHQGLRRKFAAQPGVRLVDELETTINQDNPLRLLFMRIISQAVERETARHADVEAVLKQIVSRIDSSHPEFGMRSAIYSIGRMAREVLEDFRHSSYVWDVPGTDSGLDGWERAREAYENFADADHLPNDPLAKCQMMAEVEDEARGNRQMTASRWALALVDSISAVSRETIRLEEETLAMAKESTRSNFVAAMDHLLYRAARLCSALRLDMGTIFWQGVNIRYSELTKLLRDKPRLAEARLLRARFELEQAEAALAKARAQQEGTP